MNTFKGPGIFLAQFAGDEAPYNVTDRAFDEFAGGAANVESNRTILGL